MLIKVLFKKKRNFYSALPKFTKHFYTYIRYHPIISAKYYSADYKSQSENLRVKVTATKAKVTQQFR